MHASYPLPATKIAVWGRLAAAFAIVVPAACAFPSYTFDKPEPTGGGGATPTSSASKATNSDASAGSGMGGAANTSSSSTGITCSGMANFACVTEAPGGWTGYFMLYEGSPLNDPGCLPPFSHESYTGNAGLNAPAITCSPCTCDTPTNQVCTIGPAGLTKGLFVTSSTCAQLQMGPTCGYFRDVVADGSCLNTLPLPGGSKVCGNIVNNTCPGGNMACNVGAMIAGATAAGGACTPSMQNPTKLPVNWTIFGRACGYEGATTGCNIGQVCLPTTAPPYQPGVCISKPGDNMCPQAFPNKHVYYDMMVVDTRDCTACKCGPVTNATCSATVELFSDAACNTKIASIATGSCNDLSGNPAVSGRKAIPQFTGSCAVDPAGGQPTGSVTEQNAVTYCCR